MFEFLQLKNSVNPVFQNILSAYTHTFPLDERRNNDDFAGLITNPFSKIFSIIYNNENIGYFVIWELRGFFFLEHFEVFEPYRNLKSGSGILIQIQEEFGNTVLETEPDYLNETAQRRLLFYERNNFKIITKKYLQPSYGEGKSFIDLYLLSNFDVENPKPLIKEIYKVVYHYY